MIVLQNRFHKQNYDNRALKICLRVSKRNEEIDALFESVLQDINFNSKLEGMCNIKRRGICKNKSIDLNENSDLGEIFEKYKDKSEYIDINFYEEDIFEKGVEFSKSVYTKVEEALGVAFITPRELSGKHLNVDKMNPQQIKKEILQHNKNNFLDYSFFTGIRPSIVRICISFVGTVRLYITIDKSALSDSVANCIADKWRNCLRELALFPMNLGSYVGMDNAVMNKTIHEEYFNCESKNSDTFPGYLWCNLLTKEQIKSVEKDCLDESFEVVATTENVMVNIKKSIVEADYDDYYTMKKLLRPILVKGENENTIVGELTDRDCVVIFEDEIDVNEDVVKRVLK